ncbi:PadR family transcriptional regulator [Lacticaseibacillus sp. GG6-2]
MAQRNVLQFIILGLLQQAPLTGYELTKAFDSDIGEFWSAQHSQIYPQLRKLETAGSIAHVEEVSGERLERKRYSLTDAGRDILNTWLSEATVPTTSGKDEFAVKLYFIQDITDPRLRPMLQAQCDFHEAKRTHLQHQLATKFPDGADPANFGHYLILDHAVRREDEYCQWLQAALKEVDR